jgi:hypothetical protein
MTLKNILLISILMIVTISCSTDPLNINTNEINVNTKFVNLDSILVNSDKITLIQNHHDLKSKIPDIYSYQLGYCLQIGEISDTAFANSISQFTHDKAIQKIEKRISEKFKNLNTYKNNILDGLKHLKFHFPNGKIPGNIVFMNSLFQSNSFCTEKEIGIGLERYLGKNVDVIKELPSEPFYDWIKESMNNEYLERDALCSWIMTHYINEVEGNLAEDIIKWGKILYLTEASFPTMEKNIIIRYSKQDYDWATKNEASFWKYLVDEKLLFKINDLDKSNLLSEAPFTIGLPDKSPDRFGQFLGWKIVKHYMNIKKISLKELVNIPYNTILQEYEIEE